MNNPILKVFRSKVNTAITLLIVLLFSGVVGFRILTNSSWVDSLYMTVITITTVGFKEVSPLDDDAKIFTIFLIFLSFDFVSFELGNVFQFQFSFLTFLLDGFGDITMFGQSLYNYYLVLVLISGFILLVAMIGAIVLTLEFQSHDNLL